MTKFNIAGLQLSLGVGDNMAEITKQLTVMKARFPWVDMAVLSELSPHGPLATNAEAIPGPTENKFCDLAQRLGIWLVTGSIYEKAGDKIYNTASVIDPDGNVVGRYRKMYPFLPYEKGIAAGDDYLVWDVPGFGRFGLSICYDMWFPETTRNMVWMGAEVIIHPTLTNTIDRDMELTLARANAISNQCYFFDINGGGDLAYGQSIILGPEGDILHQAGRGTEIMPIPVDFERVRHVRREGSKNFGQPLKSFRDGPTNFPAYSEGPASSLSLRGLGKLEMPGADKAKSSDATDAAGGDA
ncbi:carbon-nitrogen hydrolase family protein [Pyruvatibacter sp.]|uniref:carbon-nitrogen hydrolase family protein n=1 Tax=Pyruvatibacter sp. TaxID=1981328 RepID=UPI0032EFAC2A